MVAIVKKDIVTLQREQVVSIVDDSQVRIIGPGNVDQFKILSSGRVSVSELYKLGLTNNYVVDLGLSVKWANFNIGASACYEYGAYFAWGEIMPKNSYSEGNSITAKIGSSELRKKGIVNECGNLTSNYDAASINWRGKFRIPTQKDFDELIEKCEWRWLSIVVSEKNAVNGYYIKSRVNGNSIFLPAAGYDGTSSYNVGSYGHYWSSTVNESSSSSAYNLSFNSSSKNTGNDSRYYGLTVRPVTE